MKKRWRRRLIYFVIVAGTASFAFYQHKQSQKEKQKEEKKNLIFSSLELSQVKSIFIKRGGKKIHLLRQDKGWYMDSPVKDRADSDLVGEWLQSLLSEKVKVVREKGANWAEYGLDENIKTIEITTISDKKLKLNISYYSAFDGSFYIKKGERLLLGNTSWANLTDKEGDYFRSYKLLDEGSHPVSLRYHSKLFKIKLKWENYNWKWDGDSVFPLSHSELESYWNTITNTDFEKTVYSNTELLRKKFRLLAPAIELEMNFKKGKKWSVKLSPEVNGKFYALVSNRDYIFTLNKEQREKILLTEEKVRDHRQPFQFKKKVYFVDLKGYGVDIQVEREKEKWKLLQASVEPSGKVIKKKNGKKEDGAVKDELKSKTKEKKLDEEELQTVLNKIRLFSAKQYFDEKKSFVKKAHLVLKDKEGNLILDLQLSDPFELKGEKRVYVTSHIGKEVMALDFGDVKPVFSPSLLKTDRAKEESE